VTATLLDMFEASSGTECVMRFGSEGEGLAVSDLWHRCLGACAWLQKRVQPGEAIAIVLDSSAASLSTLVGGWLAGARVASLPGRGMATTTSASLAELAPLVSASGAVMAFAPSTAVDSAARATGWCSCDEPRGDPSLARPAAGGAFVQYSSGTTGRPKGVVLSLEALRANVEAIIEIFEDGSPLTTVSWLPLSHDMGLIGLCLAPWAYASRARRGRSTIALIAPERFLRSPSSWLRTCSELGAHATAAPTFALDLTARRPGRGVGDLSALRALCVGSEPVRANTLQAFGAAMAPLGMDDKVLCPAYGLAEAGLVVSCVRPGEGWRARQPPGASGDHEVVSAGRPALGTDVSTSDDGELLIRTPSLFDGYDDGRPAPIVDGWFGTGDTGFIRDGHVYVTGRLDDQISIGGHNISGGAVQQALAAVDGVASGRATGVSDQEGRLVVVAERRRSVGASEVGELARAVRIETARAMGVSPSRVVILAPRSFPITSNGKVRHREVREALLSDGLEVDWDSRSIHTTNPR
jgi:fatty-acyl-CoA synthase